MYHRRCIILAVDCIVKYDTPQFPFYPVPAHICSMHRFTLNYHAMLCVAAPLLTALRHVIATGRLRVVLGPGRRNTVPSIWKCLISINIEADTDGAARAEREITA